MMTEQLLSGWAPFEKYLARIFEYTPEMELRESIRRLEFAYDHADLRQFATAALTCAPAPSSYQVKHGAILRKEGDT